MCCIKDLIKERVLILDGAMGTMIQNFSLSEDDFRGTRFLSLPALQKGNNDLLSLSQPHIITQIHRKYLEAGADIIETNTFNAQRVSMSDYHCEHLCREMNIESAKIAKSIASEYTSLNPDKPRFVAGSIGPTNKSCSVSPDIDDPARRSITFDKLAEAYQEQIEALLEGGVDLLLIETVFDTLNAKAALFAASKAMKNVREVPIFLSVTISNNGGRTFSGQSLDAFITSVSHFPIFSLGLNCSFGAFEMKPFLSHLSSISPFYTIAYPNAGLPNHLGMYEQSPEEMGRCIKEFLDEGLLNIVGGCCGTTDAHISEFQEIINNGNFTPRVPKLKRNGTSFSGLDNLQVNNDFIVIGERCNVAGSKKFCRLIREKRYDDIIAIARKQISDGAQVLDINLDDGLLDSKEEMVHLLNLLSSEPEISSVPFMIDSSNWEVIEAALKCIQGKCIINSLSLKDGEVIFKQRAEYIKEMGAGLVVMAFDEKGQAETFERKIEICKRAYHILVDQVHMNPCNIIFDPNILAVCTGISKHNSYANEYIKAVRWIKDNLSGVHVTGGVSNLSFSFRGNDYVRNALHAVFLDISIKNGLDMAILNPSVKLRSRDLPQDFRDILTGVVYNEQNAAELLISMASSIHSHIDDALLNNTAESSSEVKDESLESRLVDLMVKGRTDCLQEYLVEAIDKYPNIIDIIDGPLMNGMNKVGDLFASGKIFLPQVIRTARTMKKAVSILKPYFNISALNKSNGKILIATVKGDVHDIGKNIVSLVLGCNNFDIIDLGVMCPADKIVKEAIENNVDVIALSGLITPSLDEMINVAKALETAKIDVPLVVGGAATSKKHTDLKISPCYSGATYWFNDASQMVQTLLGANNETKETNRIKSLECKNNENVGIENGSETHFYDHVKNNKLNLF